jgi:outer membrane lipoprotein SlyB
MTTFHLRATPTFRYAFSGMEPTLTSEQLAAGLAGATVRALVAQNHGYDLEVEARVPSHEQGLDAITSYLESAGFQFAQAYVVEWTNNAVQGLVTGLLGGGVLGATSENGVVTGIGALAGAAAGAWVGSQMRRAQVAFLATRDRAGRGWQLSQLPQEQVTALFAMPAAS